MKDKKDLQHVHDDLPQEIKGGFVKSKSEALIADRLHAMGVPYHYEPLVGGDGGPLLCPDFLVLNKRTRESFYWEHFGLMDDAQYSTRCVEKLAMYAEKGFLVGTDLTATFESSAHPLDTRLVERIIERMLG